MSDSGTATLGMMAIRGLRRKANTTRMARMTEMMSDRSTSRTDARIVVRLIDNRNVNVDRLGDRGDYAREHGS